MPVTINPGGDATSNAQPVPKPGAAPEAAPAASGEQSAGLDALVFSNHAGVVAGADRIPASPNSPWIFKHHPHHWEFVLDDDGDGEWLPLLTAYHIRPGVNGTKVTKRGLDIRISKGMMESSGFTLIPSDGVVKWKRTLNGKKYYHDVWSTPHVVGKQITWSFDQAAYNAWRRGLLLKGVVKPPVQIVLKHLQTVHARLLRDLGKKLHQPDVARRRAIEERRAELMSTHLASDVLDAARERADLTTKETPDA
ncbi:MAG: hypothetical protein AAFV53_32475 [Myxococcota bacterium]